MARQEADREDLMEEAVALVPRGEWQAAAPESAGVPVIVGVRRQQWISIYFGGDLCYHFDAEGRLRRAFAGGDLYRSEGTTLSRLTRVRTEAATELQRTDLNTSELLVMFQQMQQEVLSFLDQVSQGTMQVTRSIGANESEWGAILTRLREAASVPRVAPALVKRRGAAS